MSIASSFLFISLAFAANQSFTSLALKLFSDSEESIKAKQEILKIENLDEQLIKSIELGGENQELALKTIGHLQRYSLIPMLKEKVKTTDKMSKESTLFVTTLVTLSEGKQGEDVLKFLNAQIDLKSKRVPLTTRMSLLTAWNLQEKSPELDVISELLNDSDSIIRLKAMEILESYYVGDKSKLVPLLQQALTLSPYPIRMRAANLAQGLAPTDKLKLYEDLKKCQKDPQEEVRSACNMAVEQK